MTVASGAEVAAYVAYGLSDDVVVQPQLDVAGSDGLGLGFIRAWRAAGKSNANGVVPKVSALERAQSTGQGLPAAGRATAVLTGSAMLRKMLANLYAAGSSQLEADASLVVHAATAAGPAAAMSNSDAMAVRETGLAMLCAGSVQEVHDMAVVAHLVSKKDAVGFVNFWDGTRLSAQLAGPVKLLSYEAMRDMQRAAGVLDSASLVDGVEKALAQLGYRLFEYTGPEDAEEVVIAMGTAAECVASRVRAQLADKTGKGGKCKVGVLRVRLLRPWSAPHLMAALPSSTRRVCVLDQSSADAEAPLFKDVATAFHADAQWAAPLLVSANAVVPAAHGLTPSMVDALLANLASAEPSPRLTVGDMLASSPSPSPSLSPESSLELLDGQDGEASSEESSHSQSQSHSQSLTRRVVSWSLAAQTHSRAQAQGEQQAAARHATAAMLGALLHFQVQQTEQASAGTGVTRADLRFGPLAILEQHPVQRAEVVVCEDASLLLLPHCDVLAQARRGATLLVNCAWATLEDLDRELTPQVKAALARKRVKVVLVDAAGIVAEAKVSAEAGVGAEAWVTQLAALRLLGGFDYRAALAHMGSVLAAHFVANDAGAALAALLEAASLESKGRVHHVEYPRAQWAAHGHGHGHGHGQEGAAGVVAAATVAVADNVPADMLPAGMLRAAGPAQEVGAGFGAGASPVAAESNEEYDRLMQQLFGQRLLVAEAPSGVAGVAGVAGAEASSGTGTGTVAETVEAAYGAFLAKTQARRRLVEFVGKALAPAGSLAGGACSKDLLAALGIWHGTHDNAVRCSKVVPRLEALLAAERGGAGAGAAGASAPALEHVWERRALLAKATKWIVGGDSWAHDLSSNGIHHILRSGQDINVIVFDHDSYVEGDDGDSEHGDGADGDEAEAKADGEGEGEGAHGEKKGGAAAAAELNTSAMSLVSAASASAATRRTQREQQRSRSRKKDLGLYAMNYGTAYVASVSVAASQSQAIRALSEADAFQGPSIILAHVPKQRAAAAEAVDSGAWPLYRWSPGTKAGAKAGSGAGAGSGSGAGAGPNASSDEFKLDSAKLKASIQEFLSREQQLSVLANARPADPSGEVVEGKGGEGAVSLETHRAYQHAALLAQAKQRRVNEQYEALLASGSGAASGNEGGAGNADLNLLVLYGSDGGNAASVAETLAKKAEVSGCGDVRCLEANDVAVEDLAEETLLVLVTATAGQGEACANAKEFHEALVGAGVKLGGLRFAVFGLGDSHYWGEGSAESAKYFCLTAREQDERLAALGAERLVSVGLGDDQHDDSYDGALSEWEPALWEALGVTIDTSKDLGGAPPIVDDDIKIKSGFLAGNIDEGLRDTSTGKLLPEDTKLTKFHGIYQQDLRSVREERIAAKQELAYSFMIRIGLPGGVASSEQYLAMDDIITKYSGNQVLKATTRQAYQIHGVVKADMKDTMKAINRACMDTLAACGDVNRNVIGDQNHRKSPAHGAFNQLAKDLQAHLRPVAGGHTYASIWLDKKIVAGTVMEEPIYGPTYLPRKFKIALAVNGERNNVDVFCHCLGFIANMDAAKEKVASLTVTVGGGMGTTWGNKATYPRLADVLGSCSMEQALAVAVAAVTVQREFGERENRKHARFKYTVEDLGLEVLRAKMEALCGFRLGKAEPIKFEANTDAYGWAKGHDGLSDFTIFVENGQVRDYETYKLRSGLREIAKANLSGEISLTATQNVVIGAVPEARVAVVQALLDKYGIDNAKHSGMRLSSMACVALPTCALAMAESQRYLPSLIDKLEDTLDECGLRHDEIVIRMTGCPNGCARPSAAEIALIGTAPGLYHLLIGGGHAGNRLARPYKQGIDEAEILATLAPMFQDWAKERLQGEHFGDFVVRKKIVMPVIHGRCFWAKEESENDKVNTLGTTSTKNYW